MKALPCPQCGKPATNGIFCSTCLRELHPLIENIKESSITLCVKSGEVKIRHAWEKISVQEGVERIIQKVLVPAQEAIISSITVAPVSLGEYVDKPGVEKEIVVAVTVTGKVNEQIRKEYTEKYDVPLTLKTTISPKYAKIGSQYFEGTLQIRNEREVHTAFMKKEMQKHDGLAINKEVERANGHDYFFTKKNPMKIIGYDMQKRFAGFVKENARLITHDKLKSKDVHRLTLFIEFPPFAKGEIVEYEGKLLRIEGFSKKIQTTNLETGKKVDIVYKGNKNREFTKKKKQQVELLEVEPYLTIIEPETFQHARVFGVAKKKPVVGKEIDVVFFKKKWWLA